MEILNVQGNFWENNKELFMKVYITIIYGFTLVLVIIIELFYLNFN